MKIKVIRLKSMIKYELIAQLSDVGKYKMIDISGKHQISPKK